jgi:hypothetical protein
MFVNNWYEAADEIRKRIYNCVKESPLPSMPDGRKPETTWIHVYFPRTSTRNIPKEIHCEYGAYQDKNDMKNKLYAALHFERTQRNLPKNYPKIFSEICEFKAKMYELGENCVYGCNRHLDNNAPFYEVSMIQEIEDSISKQDFEWAAKNICLIYNNFTVLKNHFTF